MIRTKNLYTRNGKLYISSYTEYGRVRFATGVEDTPSNRAYVSEHIQNLIYKHLRGESKNTPTSFKLKDLSNELIESLSHIKVSSAIAYKTLKNQILKAFGNKDIRLLNPDSVCSFFESKDKKFERFYNRLIDLANTKDSNLKLKPIKTKRIRAKTIAKDIEPFSLSEIKTILEFLSQSPQALHKELLTYLYIAFFTGARTGEILALCFSDVDFEHQKISIDKSLNDLGEITSPKTASSNRYVDILEPLSLYLSNLPQCQDRIITATRAVLRNEFYEVLAHLGLKKRVIYNTRHTFASVMLSNGEEPLWVAAMLGHKNLNITYEFYAKYIPQNKQRATFLREVF